jgi:hypothetical protein
MTYQLGLILVCFAYVAIWLMAEWWASRDRRWIRRVDGIARGKVHQASLHEHRTNA